MKLKFPVGSKVLYDKRYSRSVISFIFIKDLYQEKSMLDSLSLFINQGRNRERM